LFTIGCLPSFFYNNPHHLCPHHLYAKSPSPLPPRRDCYHFHSTLDCINTGDINNRVGYNGQIYNAGNGNGESVKMLGALRGVEESVLLLVAGVFNPFL
jgi:hypothetical protein